jgi:dipeptidyl aminopeptidase/acylaminoacyl peptidase
MVKNLLTGFLVVVLILPAFAQRKQASPQIVKKPLTHAAYDEWKSITYKELTNDGKYAAYTLNPEAADGKLVLMDLSKNTKDEVPRAENIKQSWDSRYSFMLIKAQKDLVKELRREKKKKEDMPKDTLGIYSWTNKKLEKIPHVKSYKIPEKAGNWIAYQLEAATEAEKEKTNGNGQENSEKAKPARKISDENGFPLVLSNLDNGQQMTFGFVKDYTFAENGKGLLFHTTGDNGELQPGIYWYDLNEGKLQSVFEANRKHKFKYLSIDDSGSKIAFIADLDTTKALVREPKLYYWDKSISNAIVLADQSTTGIPEEWLVSENFNPYFSKDGSKLFFGTNPVPFVKDTALLAEEIVNVEVWHWQDDYIYPEQNVRADRERKRSYLAVMHLDNRKLVQLAHEKMEDINVGEEGNSKYALGKDDREYRISRTWDTGGAHDLYIVNVADGSSKLIESGVQGYSRLSPSAQYAYWFSNPDTAWFAHHIASGKTLKLTSGMGIPFADEENDVPDYPSSYGLAGWTKDDARILVYDKYDIWSFDPQGKEGPINLTKDGREKKMTYRYVNLDRDKQFIDQDEVMLLTAFDEKSKSSGYVRYSLKDRKLDPLVMSNHRYGGIQKAKEADLYLYTKENFQEFPDLYISDLNFSKPKKISEANPQQKEYIWGTAELVYWNSLDNIPLEGILYKPENFDPNKKYPMVVVYYERFSNTIHQHHKPEPIRSLVHRTMYVSNDYLIFVPDVVYSTGYPGESAFNCIIPGVNHLISQGFVDKDRVGIQGHSWSGYQTAYILTRTNMFRAAEAGAIVANMTSAYGGIRWESGRARMFQYEKAQSRLGVSLWDNPLPYIENSPLFFANKIETPMLLLHNDADGAVPWYQGIEMYLAMRRLNKPTWMLNYNGEPHWPVKRENRIDFQTRMMQFFDHYLRDAPMPRWMERGVPAIEKGIYQGLELVGEDDGD